MMMMNDTNNVDTIGVILRKRTDDGTTSRVTHLDRAAKLAEYLESFQVARLIYNDWAASLRWLIAREQKRNLLPIHEPVEEKPFVLTED